VWLEGLGKLKKLIHQIVSQTHSFPACSIVLNHNAAACLQHRDNFTIFNLVFVAKGMSFLVILTEERLSSKVQNRKKLFMAVTFVVSGGKTISIQHQNAIRFSVENAGF
jgi:hypothetical protein